MTMADKLLYSVVHLPLLYTKLPLFLMLITKLYEPTIKVPKVAKPTNKKTLLLNFGNLCNKQPNPIKPKKKFYCEGESYRFSGL